MPIETLSLAPDSRWLVWDPKHDLDRWKTLISQYAGAAPQAFLHFARDMRANLVGFIAELRQGEQHQLLRPYKYELSHMDSMTHKRVELTEGLNVAEQRARATELAFTAVHEFFLKTGPEAEALVMSPPNPDQNLPEHEHTALYWLRFDGTNVFGNQLFIDLSDQERRDFMTWISVQNGAPHYIHTEDADIAANPALLSARHINSQVEFVALVEHFLNDRCHRDTVAGVVIGDPKRFVTNQMKLEENNQQEAGLWVDRYAKFVSQGLFEEAKILISKLQMNALGLTEKGVKDLIKKAKDSPELLRALFLLPCGFLQFSFSEGGSPTSAEFGVGVLSSSELVYCPVCDPGKRREKVHCPPGHTCPRCGTLRQCG